MKTIGIYISLIAGLMLFSSASYADGNDLLQQCTQIDSPVDGKTIVDAFGAGLCVGMIGGIQMTLKIVRELRSDDAALNTCTPSSVNNGKAVRIVLAYLRANPSKLHEDEEVLTILALNEAFPCGSSDS